MSIIGTPNTRLFRESRYAGADTHALRDSDKLILNEIDGKRTVRQIISDAGLDFETGLHSIAWLMQTGIVYSGEVVEKTLQEQSDKLAFFAEIFTDEKHGQDFWEDAIKSIIKDKPELVKLGPGLSWEGLSASLSEPLPSPSQIKEYFLFLFVALYDKAEEILGADAVLAKRILLDSHPRR